MAIGTTPVLDAAAEINAVSLSRTDLDPRTLMIAEAFDLAIQIGAEDDIQ